MTRDDVREANLQALNQQLAQAENVLGQKSDEQLDQLVVCAQHWFNWDEPELVQLVNKTLSASREAKIELILSGDPICAEDGLIDFLCSMQILRVERF